jgi:hypothetical protein
MDIGNIDFTNLTLTQVFAVAGLCAFLDVTTAIVLSIVHKNFDPAYVTDYIRTHVLKVIFPILALSAIGNGVEALGIPAIPLASLAATASLAAYAAKTIASVIENFRDTSPTPEP